MIYSQVVIMSLFKQYSQRILSVIAIFLIGALSMLALAKPARAADSITQLPSNFTPDECAWVYDSLITCGLDFWYNAQQSDSSGSPVFQFRQEESGSWVWKNNAFITLGSAGDEFTASASLDPGAQGTKYTGNVTDREKRNIRAIAQDGTSKDIFGALENSKIPADGKAVGENGKDYYAFCGIKSTKGQSCFNGRGNNLYKITSDVSTKTSTGLDEGIASSERCDADMDGLLSFIFCPLFELTQKSVTNLIGTNASGSKRGFLIELMTISPMTQATTTNLYNVWKAFRDLALGLYVLVFIVIIFGNGLGMDAYTVKRTLPRLATAAVLTMASFFIIQTLVDLSNLLGAGLPALISNITNGDANIANFSLDLGAGGSALGILLLIVFSLVALVAVLVGMAGLIFRQIAVYILVIISPLAFVAWVLPNTESIFKRWWSNMIKLCMMFPIITGMIAMSLLFQKSLDSPTAPLSLKLAATLAPLMALIAIPKTFKWGGELFAAGAGFIAGRASKGVDLAKGGGTALKGGVKNMAQNKIIQSDNKVLGGNSKLGGFLAGAGAGSLVNTRGARLKRASKITGVQNEIEKAAGLRYDQAMSTQVDPLAPKEIQAQQKAAAFNKLLMKAPREERFAYAAKAAKSGDANMIGLAANSMSDPREYAQFVNRNYGDFDSQPEFRDHAVARAKGAVVTARAASGGTHTADVANAEANYRKAIRGNGMDATAPGGPDGGKMSGKNSAAISGAKPGAQKEMFYTLQADASGKTVEVVDHNAIRSMDANQVQNLITDKTQRGNLSKDTIQALREHAYVLDAAGKPVIDPATGVAQLRSGTHATAIQQGLDEHGNFK